DECARAEIEGGEIAVEDIDAAERIGGVKERLCAVDRQPRVHEGPGGSIWTVDLTEGHRAAVPSRNCSVQIGEDEVRRCAVVWVCDRERGGVGVVDLASRSLRSRCCCRDGDKARWRVDVDLSDGRLVSDGVERGRVVPGTIRTPLV